MFDYDTTNDREIGVSEASMAALENTALPFPAPPAISAPENRGFEFPRRIWLLMLACYAVFFASIFIATGGSGTARFVIVISVLYTAIYFGVARICAAQAGPEVPSPLDRRRALHTNSGPMDGKSVFGQVLIVPIAIAVFGVSILIITALII